MATERCYIVETEDGPWTEFMAKTDDEVRAFAERFARERGCSGRVGVWDKVTDTLVMDFVVA